MIKVNILASENALFSTIFGPFDMFIQAGIFWNTIIGTRVAPYFDVKISSVEGEEIKGLADARIKPHRKIQNRDRFDLIIVPSEGMHIDPDNPSFQRRVDYLSRMHGKGSVIASVCTGAFLVAATGLLSGKVATTHWALAREFSNLYPDIYLNTDLLIADTGAIVTSGGVSADQDLSMHLIERLCGHEIALQTARCTLVPFSDRQQKFFKTFVVRKNHGDRKILQCQEIIQKSLHKEISNAELSQAVNIGTRTLNRRFKQATGFSVVAYIQQLRIERAKYILERENTSFEEIAHELGYDNVSFFRRIFKQHVGMTPKAYRHAFLVSIPSNAQTPQKSKRAQKKG